MKGTFKITLDYLKELGACSDGQREFQKAFPNGGGYQEVLNRCAEEGRLDFADWLFAHIGPTDDFLVYDEALNTPDKNIIFAGRIEFKLSAKARYIRSGCGIEAGEGIEAGGGYGIFAGQAVEVCNWDISAVVTAKTRPENLISGFWKERDE